MTPRGTILVTGAAGFIGSHLVLYLKQQGYWVRGVDLKYPDSLSHNADDFLLLDLRRQEDCLEATRNIDEVYALAADTGGSGYLPLRNVSSTYNNLLINLYTLEAARIRRVRRYLFASSLTTTLNLPRLPANLISADEDLFLRQQTAVRERQMGELLCLRYGADHRIITRIVRLANVFGPQSIWEGSRERVPAALCRKIALAKLAQTSNIEIWGNGEQIRSFCYIADCVSAVYQAMHSSQSVSAVYGPYSPLSINYLTDIIAGIAGIQVTKQYIPGPDTYGWNASQDSNIPPVVGKEPTTPLEQGLRATYTWIEERVRIHRQGLSKV
jgi:GDP-D-mannose 3', 5'-epimerase